MFNEMEVKKEMVKEPNLFIEAKHNMTKEELLLWAWFLTKTKFFSDREGKVLTLKEVEEAKENEEIIYALTDVELKELEERYPDVFNREKRKKLHKVLQRMEGKKLFKVSLPTYYQLLEELGFGYLKRKLIFPSENYDWYGIPIIMAIFQRKDLGALRVVYTPYVAPILLLLKKKYTLFEFEEILKLKSKHSIILYRLLREKIGLKRESFQIDAEELIQIMTDGKRYPVKVFKPLVLDKAVKEINEKTSLKVEYETVKRGRGARIVAFKFTVRVLPRIDAQKDREELLSLLKDFLRFVNISTPEGFDEDLKLAFIAHQFEFKRIKPSVALWYLLHRLPEEHQHFLNLLKGLDENEAIKLPDLYLKKRISNPKSELELLIKPEVEDLSPLLFAEIAKPYKELKEFEELAREIKRTLGFLDGSMKRKVKERFYSLIGVSDTVIPLKEIWADIVRNRDLERLKKLSEVLDEFGYSNIESEFDLI